MGDRAGGPWELRALGYMWLARDTDSGGGQVPSCHPPCPPGTATVPPAAQPNTSRSERRGQGPGAERPLPPPRACDLPTPHRRRAAPGRAQPAAGCPHSARGPCLSWGPPPAPHCSAAPSAGRWGQRPSRAGSKGQRPGCLRVGPGKVAVCLSISLGLSVPHSPPARSFLWHLGLLPTPEGTGSVGTHAWMCCGQDPSFAIVTVAPAGPGLSFGDCKGPGLSDCGTLCPHVRPGGWGLSGASWFGKGSRCVAEEKGHQSEYLCVPQSWTALGRDGLWKSG